MSAPETELERLRAYAVRLGTAVYIAARRAGNEEAAAEVLAEMGTLDLEPQLGPGLPEGG